MLFPLEQAADVGPEGLEGTLAVVGTVVVGSWLGRTPPWHGLTPAAHYRDARDFCLFMTPISVGFGHNSIVVPMQHKKMHTQQEQGLKHILALGSRWQPPLYPI